MDSVQASDGTTSVTFSHPVRPSSRLAPDYLSVTLAGPDMTACRQVYAGWSSGFAHLSQYVDFLARDWRGWSGDRTFESIEHDLVLSARHDGHVTVVVVLRDWSPRGWRVEASVRLEAGEQLARLAAELRDLILPG